MITTPFEERELGAQTRAKFQEKSWNCQTSRKFLGSLANEGKGAQRQD